MMVLERRRRNSGIAYNAEAAMNYWGAQMGRIQKFAGGVDVVIIGDSITEGFGVLNLVQMSYANQFRRAIQARLNPKGVNGGLGYFSAATDSSMQYPRITRTNFSLDNSTGLIAHRGASNGNVANATIEVTLNSSASPTRMDGKTDAGATATALPYASDLELLSYRAANFSKIKLYRDLNAGSYTDLGELTLTPNGTESGVRAGCLDSQATTFWNLGSTPTSGTYRFKVEATEAKSCYIEGFLHYDGDFKCGVRVHRLGHHSMKAIDLVDSTKTVNGVQGGAYAASCRSMFGELATANKCWHASDQPTNKRIGAYVLEFGWNEYVQSTQTSPATYYGALKEQINQINAYTSPKASIVLLAMPAPPFTDDAAKSYKYAQYVQSLYSLADEFPDQVCVLDLFKASGSAQRIEPAFTSNAFLTGYSMLAADNFHPNEMFGAWASHHLLRLFTP